MEHRTVRVLVSILTLLAAAVPAWAQPSNSSLKGVYAFRYLGASLGTSSASCNDCPVAAIGTVTFDGAGNFTVSAQGVFVTTTGSSSTLTPAASGKYTVFSSGMYYMDNPFAASNNSAILFGGIGQGAIVASSTESNYLDEFVAIPQAAGASNSTLSGTYQVASLEFAGGTAKSTRNTIFNLTADGKGSLGNVSIKGSSPQLNNVTTTQVSNGATYSVNGDGSGTMTFPAPGGVATANQLLAGTKNSYVSQDGNIFIAGTPNGFDFIIGIKAMAAPVPNPPVKGLYFAGELLSDLTGGTPAAVSGYWGATNELGDANATELTHLRVNSDSSSVPYDETYDFYYTFDKTGVSSDTQVTFAAGANGNMYIVAGDTGYYYLAFGVKVQPVTGSGVFLSPTGVVNAATFSPFTAQLSPGELITLFGSGFAPAGTLATASAPFPNTLAGVSVTINGVNAPVYVVTATQISALVPYTLDPTATFKANIQVTSNNQTSNTVTEYLGLTSPGVFTTNQNGLGNGAILHADFTAVTETSPAKPGETVLVYLTGLGAVSPAVTTGAAAPTNPLSTTTNQTSVSVDGINATVLYSGLAPGFAGLYQLNVTIPNGVTRGTDVYLEVDGYDAITVQSTIPISK